MSGNKYRYEERYVRYYSRGERRRSRQQSRHDRRYRSHDDRVRRNSRQDTQTSRHRDRRRRGRSREHREQAGGNQAWFPARTLPSILNSGKLTPFIFGLLHSTTKCLLSLISCCSHIMKNIPTSMSRLLYSLG